LAKLGTGIIHHTSEVTMKLLVTGGLGFIGSNFCRLILTDHQDYELVNIDKVGVGANPANLRDLENEKRYTFIKGDIGNTQILNKAIKHADAVVNIAAETHVDRSISDPFSFLQNNTLGTYTILEALRKHNDQAKLVQVSTDEVYGEIPEGSFTENDAVKPSNPYSASKAAADMFVQAYHKTYGLNAVITRCTNNFGPYQFPEKLIPFFIFKAMKDEPVPVYGDGLNVRDWLYVEDHCRAIDAVLTHGKVGETYCVGGQTQDINNLSVVKKILTSMGKSEDMIEFVKDRPGHDRRYAIDWTKINTELGWQPKHDFDTWLGKTIEWYKSHESWWRPLKK